MERIAREERRARLVARHRLGRTALGPVDAARSVVCLHATDPVTVFLAIRARTEGVTPADVEHAFYEERGIVRLLAMRRTLWALPRDLVPVAFAAATPRSRHGSGSGWKGSRPPAGSPAPAPGSRAP